MATKRKAAAVGSKGRLQAGGIHPVFGSIADPGSDDWGGGSGGGWAGHISPGFLHFGPVADPAPFLRGRASLVATVDPRTLDAATQRQVAALRARGLRATIKALREQVVIAGEELKLLSRSKSIRLGPAVVSPIDPGDPVLDIRPLDFIRYLHDLRVSALERTITFLEDSAKAIEASR